IQPEESPQQGYFYRKFNPPVVSDAAGQHVAFYSSMPGGRRCIFRVDPDAPTAGSTIACEHFPTPDNSRAYRRLGDPSINASGDVAFSSQLSFGYTGVFRNGSATIALLGDPVPTPGTGTLKILTSARVTDLGNIFFLGTISGGTVDQGIFVCPAGQNCHDVPGTLATVVLAGDPVPDRVGRKLCSFSALAASNSAIVFRAITKPDCSMNSGPLEGIFRKPSVGPIETIALMGETSNPSGTTYAAFSGAPAIENGGAVAFLASAAGSVSTSAQYVCATGCPPAPADAVVERGQLAPTSPSGTGPILSFTPPGIDGAHDIAFSARVRDQLRGLSQGVYRRTAAGQIEAIALLDQPAPDPDQYWRYVYYPPAMSPGGRIAFKASIITNPAPRKRLGIFATGSPSGAFVDAPE